MAPAGPAPSLRPAEFAKLRALVHERVGIDLTGKERLLASRLYGEMRELGLTSFRAYHDHVVSDPTGRALSRLVDRVSTNHTYFYREHEHFDFVTERVLPEAEARLRRARSRDLRVWSAGCSSGEEPYLLAMLQREYFGSAYVAWDGGVLATDLSARVLQTAAEGRYPDRALKHLPEHYRTRYFEPAGPGQWRVVAPVRGDVTFRRFNLTNDRFPFKRPFHAVFCRNVMIYFDPPTTEALLRRFHAGLEEGGYLFVGQTESLGREQRLFTYVQPGVYQRAAR